MSVSETPTTPAEETPVAERTELPRLWMDLARQSEQTAVETARRMPVVGHGIRATERVSRWEYGLLRAAIHGPTDVDVTVNVDVLSRGLRVDLLRNGVNMSVL